MVGIDDIMPFQQKFIYSTDANGEIIDQEEELYLYFGQPDRDRFPKVMWGPILEKAFAKIMGSYTSTQFGFIQNSMRAILNCPIMTYYTRNIDHDEDIDDTE